mgnify:CR=1 FL=1
MTYKADSHSSQFFLYVKIIFSENIHIYNVVFNDA